MQLRDLQRQFSHALKEGALPSALEQKIETSAFSPEEKISIYRNNFRLSLTEALAVNFPVTLELVDRRFFEPVAWDYIRRHPPTQPSLFAYGEHFGEFLAELPSLSAYPYIPEVARFEFLLNKAGQDEGRPSPDLSPPKGDAMLLAEARWQARSSLLLFRSPYPVVAIWEAHRFKRDLLEKLEIAPAAERILIFRHDGSVRTRSLTEAAFTFLEILLRTGNMQEALPAALAIDPHFPLAEQLEYLLARKLIYPLT